MSEFREAFKHFYLKGLTLKKMKVFTIVYNSVNEVKRGRTSTNDEHRSACPMKVLRSK